MSRHRAADPETGASATVGAQAAVLRLTRRGLQLLTQVLRRLTAHIEAHQQAWSLAIAVTFTVLIVVFLVLLAVSASLTFSDLGLSWALGIVFTAAGLLYAGLVWLGGRR